MRTILLVLTGIVVVFAIGTLWGNALVSGTRRIWEVVTGAEDEATVQADAPGDTPEQFWTCGMHPWVIFLDLPSVIEFRWAASGAARFFAWRS